METSLPGEPRLPAPPALTARAVAAGLASGAVLAVANVFMRLRTGWWDSGSITASLLGAALLSALARWGGRPAAPLETLAAGLALGAGAALAWPGRTRAVRWLPSPVLVAAMTVARRLGP